MIVFGNLRFVTPQDLFEKVLERNDQSLDCQKKYRPQKLIHFSACPLRLRLNCLLLQQKNR